MRFLALGLIRLYQLALRPFFGNCCRFYPSCSDYAYEAFRRCGFFQGTLLMIYRLVRCHPWHPGGVDEVPCGGLRQLWNAKRLSRRKGR